MAKQIMQEPDQIQAVMSRSVSAARRAPGGEGEKVMIARRCSVQEFSFAAHVDGTENREFIEEVNAPVVVSAPSWIPRLRSWLDGADLSVCA
jgi:cleavage and polyadenylation specificity factor subunit 3